MSATVESPDSLNRGSFRLKQPGVPTPTLILLQSAKMNFQIEIPYNPTSNWLGRHVESLP
jgi:hypothetical protein